MSWLLGSVFDQRVFLSWVVPMLPVGGKRDDYSHNICSLVRLRGSWGSELWKTGQAYSVMGGDM